MRDIAERYRRALPAGETFDFDLRPLDKVGLPASTASWYGADGGQAHGNGYGMVEDLAVVGAYGELAEAALGERRVRCMVPVRASYAELVRARGRSRVVDPLALCLPAGSRYDEGTILHWLPMTRLSTGEEVLVPAELVASAPGEVPADGLVLPVTNGQGAGDSLDRALTHALLELAQRDTNILRFRALDRGVVLDLDEVTDPGVTEAVARLGAAGIRVLPKLAATDFGMASVYVVGDDADPRHPLQVTACGEAVHPDREVALRKALTEYASSRCRKVLAHGPLELLEGVAPAQYLSGIAPGPQEPRAMSAMAAWESMDAGALRALLAGSVLSERARVPLSALPTVPPGSLADPTVLLTDLRERFSEFDVLFLDCSPEMSSGADVTAVKVVVPGLEAETMSYGRIGEWGVRRLLETAGTDPGGAAAGLVGLGEPPAGAAPVRLTDEAAQRLGGPAWFSYARAEAVVGPLYPLYREPDRHAMAVLGSTAQVAGVSA